MRKNLGELLSLALDKDKWDYLGRWVQPTLSTSFWGGYSTRPGYYALGLSEPEADYIELDGHSIDWKENKKNIEQLAVESARSQDDENLKKLVGVSSKCTGAHLELSNNLKATSENPANELEKFFHSMDNVIPAWIPAIYFGYVLESAVSSELKKSGLTHLQLESNFALPKPTMIMRQEREAREFSELVRNADMMHSLEEEPGRAMEELDSRDSALTKRMSEHLKEFEWVGTHHCWGEPLTLAGLLRQMKEMPAERKPEKSAKIPERLAWLIGWQNEFGFWRQYCAETSDVGLFKARGLLKTAAAILGLNYEDIIWLSDREILVGLESGVVPSKEELSERKKGFGYAETEDEEIVITGDRLRKLVAIQVPKVDATVRQFVGTVGSRGFVVGEAFVCATPHEAAAMKKGQILVVPQTTPDYVVVMKKAAAIITDEGGVTCHAAVVSRELGVPCVVGTKVATRVLKTGDKVEVDANTGVIKRL